MLPPQHTFTCKVRNNNQKIMIQNQQQTKPRSIFALNATILIKHFSEVSKELGVLGTQDPYDSGSPNDFLYIKKNVFFFFVAHIQLLLVPSSYHFSNMRVKNPKTLLMGIVRPCSGFILATWMSQEVSNWLVNGL